MKIRKRVMDGFIFVLVLSSLLLFQGCNSGESNDVESNEIRESAEENIETASPAEKDQNKESLLDFSDDISTIHVTHSSGGGQDSWEMDKKDIPQFREWTLSLQLESQNFAEGESPGEYNGGDAYSFEVSGDTPLNFTYMDIGDGNYYIRIKDQWYLIANHINLPEILCTAEPQIDYTDIKQLPAEYSEDMAIRDGVVVYKFDEILNKELLYRFCDSYLEGKDAMVRIMLYTIEGDPIIQDISYRDKCITVITDSSRDTYGSGDFDEMKFRYIVEHKGLLYLSKNKTWEDDKDFFFAGIGDKDVWKGHISKFRN